MEGFFCKESPRAVFFSFSLASGLAELKIVGPSLVSGPLTSNEGPGTLSLANFLAQRRE